MDAAAKMTEKDGVNASYVAGFDMADLKGLDSDALKLAEMGYKQDLRRNYTVLSVLGVGFSLTNSWWGIAAALITGIKSGGPVLIVYGIILLTLVSTCVGITLSELASAYPNAGGQYFWASELAPKRYANFASYLTGWLAWAGSIFTSASVALGTAVAAVGCWQLAHPDCYQILNIFAFFFNCYARALPALGQITLWTSLVSFFVILVAVPAKAPTHQHAKFVFANFVNETGWSQNGIAFIVGLINTNYAFACLDCATHLSEEIHRPEKMIPVAILSTVAIGFVTSWTFSIALFFSMSNVEDLSETATGVPLLALFDQALNSKAGAIALEALVIATGIGCLIASHTWQSRLCWSFARDHGIPFSSFFAKVDRRLDVPIRAHAMSCTIVAIVGCLYLGAYTAFNRYVPWRIRLPSSINSQTVQLPVYDLLVMLRLANCTGKDDGVQPLSVMETPTYVRRSPPSSGYSGNSRLAPLVSRLRAAASARLPINLANSFSRLPSMVTACIVLLYISYSIPVICLLIRGRNNIPRGPFWMGPVGLFSNIVLLLWTCFTLIMYSFPSAMPVASDNMNYVSAVYGILVLTIIADWFLRGRHHYRGHVQRHDETIVIVGGGVQEKTMHEVH
ncbi:MAG: hypothetical protein Q9196_001778 [Gyalolechia fulgens]